jgi:hypothetical protein
MNEQGLLCGKVRVKCALSLVFSLKEIETEVWFESRRKAIILLQ